MRRARKNGAWTGPMLTIRSLEVEQNTNGCPQCCVCLRCCVKQEWTTSKIPNVFSKIGPNILRLTSHEGSIIATRKWPEMTLGALFVELHVASCVTFLVCEEREPLTLKVGPIRKHVFLENMSKLYGSARNFFKFSESFSTIWVATRAVLNGSLCHKTDTQLFSAQLFSSPRLVHHAPLFETWSADALGLSTPAITSLLGQGPRQIARTPPHARVQQQEASGAIRGGGVAVVIVFLSVVVTQAQRFLKVESTLLLLPLVLLAHCWRSSIMTGRCGKCVGVVAGTSREAWLVELGEELQHASAVSFSQRTWRCTRFVAASRSERKRSRPGQLYTSQVPARLLRYREDCLVLRIDAEGGAFEHISTGSLKLKGEEPQNTRANTRATTRHSTPTDIHHTATTRPQEH